MTARVRCLHALLALSLLAGCSHDHHDDEAGPLLSSFKPLLGKWVFKPTQGQAAPAFLEDMKRFPGSEGDAPPTLKEMRAPGRKLELTFLTIVKVDVDDLTGMVQVFSGGKSVCVTPLGLHVEQGGKRHLQVGRGLTAPGNGYAMKLEGSTLTLTPSEGPPLLFERVTARSP